jgi:hypothetical protein
MSTTGSDFSGYPAAGKDTLIGRLPFAKKLYKIYLPLMPMALEQLDLRDWTGDKQRTGPAKVLTRPDAAHVCCHTPMRYVWNIPRLQAVQNPLLSR